jgi:hypothetical protein
MLEYLLDEWKIPLTPGDRERLERNRREQNPTKYDPKPLPLHKEVPMPSIYDSPILEQEENKGYVNIDYTLTF